MILMALGWYICLLSRDPGRLVPYQEALTLNSAGHWALSLEQGYQILSPQNSLFQPPSLHTKVCSKQHFQGFHRCYSKTGPLDFVKALN